MVHSSLNAFIMIFTLWLCRYFVEMMHDDPFKKMWFMRIHSCICFPLCHLHYNYVFVWWKWYLMIIKRMWFIVIHSLITCFPLYHLHYKYVFVSWKWYLMILSRDVIHSWITCLPLCHLHYVFVWWRWCLMILSKRYDSWWSMILLLFALCLYALILSLPSCKS